MAIQCRRGAYEDFDKSKMLPGEWAVVLSGDPVARDGKAAYMSFGGASAKRMATYEDMHDDIQTATEDIVADASARFDDKLAEAEQAERSRQEAEDKRKAAESARASAEKARVTAEAARAEKLDQWLAEHGGSGTANLEYIDDQTAVDAVASMFGGE